jgi:hypothetical protein
MGRYDPFSETTQKALTLMAGIDHPPFDSASVYLLDVKRLHSQLDAAKKKELRALLTSLQQTNDEEIIDFYTNLKRHKTEQMRRWLEGLPGTVPPELTAMLNTSPTEEACRRELHELALECLKLIG